jgi:hypothetical protein
MARLSIAPKRAARDEVGPNWYGGIVTTQGVQIQGALSPLRIQLEATAEAEAEIRRLLGPRFHIERLISHLPSADTGAPH